MAKPTPAEVKSTIKAKAHELGFEAFGVADLDMSWEAGGRLEQFVAQGRHGEMGWMETTLPRRLHPRAMWPDARSALVLGLNYGPHENPLAALERKSLGAVSVYAKGQDYHDVIKTRLKALGRWMAQTYGWRVEGVRRHRAPDGKAPGPARRPGGGRASTPIWCRATWAPGCSWVRC